MEELVEYVGPRTWRAAGVIDCWDGQFRMGWNGMGWHWHWHRDTNPRRGPSPVLCKNMFKPDFLIDFSAMGRDWSCVRRRRKIE